MVLDVSGREEMIMLKHSFFVACALAACAASGIAFAAQAKTYQVTGPVLDSSGDMIVVQKGKDRWEIGRDASTKVTGDAKIGDKVTIEYRMTATSIESKNGGAKAASKKSR
jgi:hypothetical protein